MARQRLTGESAPSQTVEQEARFTGVTKRRYQQVLQATREELGLAPPNSGGRPPAAAGQEDAEALDLERMLELQAETIEALVRAAGPATPCMPWAGPMRPRAPPKVTAGDMTTGWFTIPSSWNSMCPAFVPMRPSSGARKRRCTGKNS